MMTRPGWYELTGPNGHTAYVLDASRYQTTQLDTGLIVTDTVTRETVRRFPTNEGVVQGYVYEDYDGNARRLELDCGCVKYF